MPALNKRTIKVTDAYVRRIYLNQCRSAWIRAATSVFIFLLSFGAYLLQAIKANNLMGIGVAGVFLCLMNPPLLLLLKHSKDVPFSNVVSFVVNFSEIIGYTIIIYFLGGIKSLWLSLIYAVLIYYVGMIGPRWRTFLVATCCWAALSLVVALEYFGFIPSQYPVDFPGLAGRYQTAIMIGIAVYLYGVAFISDYMGGLLRKRERELKDANLELGQNSVKLKQAEKELRKSYVELEKRVEERTAQLAKTNENLRQEIADRRQAEEALRKSEEYFKTIIHNSSDIILILDKLGTIIYASSSVEHALGYGPDELIGKRSLDLIVPDDKPRAIADFGRALSVKEILIPNNFRIKHKDGTERTFEGVGNNLLDNQIVAGFVVNVRDITDRKQAEEALRRSEENFRNSLDDSPLGVRIVTEEGETIYVNRAMLDIYGYDSIEELKTTPVEKRYTPESQAEFQIRSEKRKQGGNVPSAYEVSIVRKDGEVRHLQVFRKGILWDGEKQSQVIYKDTTDRKQAGEALLGSEVRVRELFNRMIEGVAVYTTCGNGKDFIFKDINIAGEKLSRLKREQIVGRSLLEIFPGIRDIGLFQVFQRVWRTGIPEKHPSSLYRDDRISQWVENDVYKLPSGEIVAVYEDVTERKQMEAALIDSESRYRMLFELSPDGIVIIDPATSRPLEFNETAYRQLGYSREEFARLTISDLDISETPDETRERIQNVICEGRNDFETLQRTRQGDIRNILVTAQNIEISGRPVYHCIWRDITERKRAEDELRVSRERLRALAGRLQAVREEERTQIAREIHDELGGALTGLKIDFSQLKRDALKIENEAVRASLLADIDPMIKFTDATIHTVRRIAMELRPGVLDDLGLVAALEWLLGDFQKRTGIRCEWISSVEYIELDVDLSTALFRIAQESLTNVARHSGATGVRVHFRVGPDSFILEIKDNGTGMKKEKIMDSTSLGFLGMRERALMFGGSLRVKGTPRTGTKVTVEIPLTQRGPDQKGDTG